MSGRISDESADCAPSPLAPMKQRVRGASSNGALRRKGRTPPDPQKQSRPSCCKKIISYTDSGPTEAGGFTSDQTMSTRNHANTRGQRHQWRVGLTAWIVYGKRRLWAIVGTLLLWMVLSSMRFVSTLSSSFLPACVLLAGLRH